MKTSKTFCILGVLIALLAGGGTLRVARGQIAWTGVSDTDWSNAANWAGTAPGGGDIALFNANSAYPNQPNLTVASPIGGLWYTGGAALSISGSPPLTVNGATISGNASTGIELDAGAGSLAIEAPLYLASGQTWLNNSSNLVTVSANVDNGGNLLNVAGNGNVSVSGNISDSGGLTMNGAGMLILSGNNSYTGDTKVNSGMLVAASPVFGTGAMAGNLYVNNGGTVVVNAHDALFGSAFQSGTATINAGGVLTIGTAVCDVGPVVLTGGTLAGTGDPNWGSWWLNNTVTATGGAVSTISAVGMTLPQTQTFFVDSGSTLNVTGNIVPTLGASNTGGITLTGSGMMILAGYNSYTGDTIINGGTLVLATKWSTLGASNLTINGGGSVYVAQQDGLWAGAANTKTLTVAAGGLLTIGPQPNDLGPVVLTGGTLAGNGDPGYGSYWFNGMVSATGSAVSTLSSLGMTLVGTQTFFVDSGSTLNVTGSFVPTDANNTGGIVKTGSGTMILANANGYVGGTLLQSGVLQVASTNGVGVSSGTVTVNGGTLDLESQYGSLGGNLNINSGGTVYVGQYDGLYSQGNLQTVTIGAGGLLTVYANPTTSRIATCDLGSLVLTGGTLDGAGDQNWGSWWLFGGVSATGSAVSTMSALGMTMSQTQTFFVDSGSTLNVTGNISVTAGNNQGGIIKTGLGMMVLSGSNNYTGGTTVNDGTLVVQTPDSLLDASNLSVGDPMLLQHFGGAQAAASQPGFGGSAVPEPGTSALLAVAGLALLFRWRR
jgi:MYXO-CTERM domain-containing protein